MKRLVLVLTLGCLLSGCNLLFPPGGGGTETKAGLKSFESRDELAAYLAAQINVQNDRVTVPARNEVADGDAAADPNGGAGGPAQAPTAEGAADDGSGSFSGTTVQEQGVDEADVVKTDGTYLYVLQSDYVGGGSELKIVRADAMAVVGEIDLSGYAREFYLHGSRVVALTETYGNYYFIDAFPVEPRPDDSVVAASSEGSAGTSDGDRPDSSDAVVDGGGSDGSEAIPPGDDLIYPDFTYSRPKTIVTVIDAAVPNLPTRVSTTEYDGTASSSRMIDGVLHVVLSNYQNYFFDVLPALGRPGMAMQEANPDDLLPHYRHIDAQGVETEGMVLTWENVYRPETPDGFGVLAVVSMDADNSDVFDAVGVVAEPGLIYSSTTALYVTNTNYDFLGEMRTTTDIYKFLYEGARTVPVASGRVSGRVLNQYSMGEHNGFLRVATTSDPVFDAGGVVTRATNNVYVVGESGGELRVVGRLENLAPGETIQSARFLGDRGYLVTFEQIDPLFTLDLADPTAPKAVGELKVPGFSTFIVPMDADHILTVGQYIPDGNAPFFRPWGVQLSIFDVSDFANPALAHQVVIGADSGAYSEALYNPKAFTYFAERGLVALPMSIYEPYIYDGGGVTVIDVDVDGSASGGGSSGGSGVDSTVAEPPADDDAMGDGADGSGGDAMIDEPFAPYVPGGFEGLYVYEVSAAGGFSDRGRLSTRFESAGYYDASYTRGVFIDDEVYAVTDNGLRSASLADIGGTARELLLRDANPYYVYPVEPGVDPEKPDDGGAVDSVDGADSDANGGATEPGRPIRLKE